MVLLLFEKGSVLTLLRAKQGNYLISTIFFIVFGMTHSKSVIKTQDSPHLKPALYH